MWRLTAAWRPLYYSLSACPPRWQRSVAIHGRICSRCYANGKDSINERLLERVRQSMERLPDKPSSAVLAVSGGVDSLAALHLLRQVMDLQVVHFDHQRRGSESDADRELVKHVCVEHGLPLQVFDWQTDCPHQPFSQASARQWRQQRLRQAGSLIITAHHQDDSDESLLLKLVRGAHLTNLSGMHEIRQQDHVTWWRPLLSTTKSELIDYMTANCYEWREDASNAEDDYLRNRIRHYLIPLLADLTKSRAALHRRLAAMENQSRQVADYLEQQANAYQKESGTDDTWFVLPIGEPINLVHQHALHGWIKRQQQQAVNDESSIGYEHLQRIVAQLVDHPDRRQWRLQLGEGWEILRIGNVLQVKSPLDVTPNGKTTVQPRPVSWSVVDGSEANVEHGRHVILALPKDQLSAACFVLDTMSSHDFLTPPWRSSPVKITNLLRAQKIPLHLRPTARCLRLGDQLVAVEMPTTGEWIVDARYVVDPDSTRPDKEQQVILAITI